MHRRPLRLLLALTAALFGLLTSPAAADDARIEVNVAVSGSKVTVYGTLTAGNQPLKKQDVSAYIDGVAIGRDQTRGNGQFAVEAEVNLAGGRHTATVRYDGKGGVSGTHKAVSFDTPTQARQPEQPATQAPAPPNVQMSLTASVPAGANNGEMITISGALKANGAPVAGAGISVSDASGEVADSYTVTADNGNFQTMYLVPEDQPEGNLKLTLSFAASGSFPAASRSVALPIKHLELQSAQPTAEAVAADAKASSSPPPSAPATQSAPAQSPAGSNTPAAKEPATSPMTWFVVSLLGIAALAVVALVVMVARAGYGRRNSPPSEGAIDFLNDELDGASPFADNEDPTQSLDSFVIGVDASAAFHPESVTEQTAPLAAADLAEVVASPDFGVNVEPQPVTPRRGLPTE